MKRLSTALVLALAACGCRAGAGASADGGADVGVDAVTGDAPQPLALAFAVTGCAQYDVAGGRCSGTPPLMLAFSPVSSPSLTRFLWSFGDGTPDSYERAPVHTYVHPGNYDVTLTGAGSVGTARSTQRVSVGAVAVGAPCDVDDQCATGLACTCGSGKGCSAGLVRGLCAAPCTGGVCAGGAACASLGGPSGADGGAGDAGDAGAPPDPGDFRAPTCLASCQQDLECAPGLTCRDLPGGGGAGQPRWARVCFPAFTADVGMPCRDASGNLVAAACVTGTCADLGALGLCAAPCGPSAPCPTDSACAAFGDGRALCLRVCAGAQDCARDPLLACVSPGGAGGLGFTVADAPAGTTYCAPRPCATTADCAPAGVCAAGHCTLGP